MAKYSKWQLALLQYNREVLGWQPGKGNKLTVPRKGSIGYNKVKELQANFSSEDTYTPFEEESQVENIVSPQRAPNQVATSVIEPRRSGRIRKPKVFD